jgi:hypothetical protein
MFRSREIDRATKIAAVAALVTGFALSSTSFAQSAATASSIDELLDQVRAVESREGESSPSLIALYTELGLRYQDKNEPAHAAAATQRALEILRVNEGLYTLDQAPLIRQLMRNALALGDHDTAWELEQALLRLSERDPNDLRTAQILSDVGDRRIEILERYNAAEFPPEIVLGCYYSEPTTQQFIATGQEKSCAAGTRRRVQLNLASEALSYYSHAADILVANGSDELPILLKKVVASSWRYNTPYAWGLAYTVSRSWRELGRKSLSHLLAYQNETSAPWPARIDTLVQIADWDLMYAFGLDQKDMALSEYAEAYDLCKQQGLPQETIDRMFSPRSPVPLPVFVRSPLVTNEAGSAGHLDIGFEVDKYGESGRVRTRSWAGSATPAVEKSLEQVIEHTRFRPRLVDGKFAGTGPIVVRYYVNADFRPLVYRATR